MNETRLTQLFHAYFSKTATHSERDELMELLANAENDEHVKSLLAKTWEQFNSRRRMFNDSQGDVMLANILKLNKGFAKKHFGIIGSKNGRSHRWLRTTAAAAILFFAVTGGYLWLNHRQPVQQLVQSEKNHKEKDAIVPGGNRAILTLSDGSSIVLDSTQQGTLAKQGNAKVIKLNTATLAYNDTNEPEQEIVYNTLTTPNGGQYQLLLQDGTRVWLNASSSIHFPTIFKGKERNVSITGEAYFEVAKNAAMPFKINVKDIQVQVLGTHLNIMAYEDESSMNTTLLEGSVRISKGSLSRKLIPGQQSMLSKTGDLKVVETDVEEVMAWKNGWFQFNDYGIEKVLRQISRWYDVEIVYEGKIPMGHFSGLVSRENSISQVLKIMQAGGVRFKIEGRKVVVLF